MLGLLRAILAALRDVLANQQEAASLAAANQAELDGRLDALDARVDAVSAAVEHIRVLVEDDSVPTAVGVPTFTPQE